MAKIISLTDFSPVHLPGFSAVAVPDSKRDFFRQSCAKLPSNKPLEVKRSHRNGGSHKGPGSWPCSGQ